MPRACAARTTSATGAMQPVTFDTWPMETSFVRGVSSDSIVSHRGTPSASIGIGTGFACDAPRQPVGVVLARGEDDLVVGSERERVPDQVDGLGRAAHEDDLVRRGADETRHLEARGVVEPRGLLAERVHAAVDVGGAPLVVVHDRVDDRARLGRRRRAVE